MAAPLSNIPPATQAIPNEDHVVRYFFMFFFLKKIENMFSVLLLSPISSCFHSISRSPKLPLVFP